MKATILFFILVVSQITYAQKKFFKLYTDSVSLVADANQIVSKFTTTVNVIKPVISAKPEAILNTKPFLIFYSPKANRISLPLWDEVMPAQKDFFYKLAGSKKKGEKMFGLFFNGFYLAHELGHALHTAAGKGKVDLYQGEYLANIVGILYWRMDGRKGELKRCYKLARRAVADIPNPVPEGEDPIAYFNTRYQELGADPYKYGYFQFAQFVKIYEDKSLPNFDDYVRNYLANK